MAKRKRKIKLPGPRWLQFIIGVILADLLIYAIVAGSCWLGGRCSTVDWSNRMFWGGMAVFAIGLPAVGASFMGLSGSTAIGGDAMAMGVNSSSSAAGNAGAAAMGMEANAMHDVIKHEQGAQKKRMKFFWWPFTVGAGAILISLIITQTAPSLAGLAPDFSKPDRAMPSKVVTQFEEEIERSVNFIPISGATLAIWDGENPVFAQGYGDTGDNIEQRYPIGALTQQFTAVAILQLAEAGEVSLDGVVTAYIPELPDSYYAIKLKHLLTHTSGLPGDADVMAEIEAVLGADPWHSDSTYTAGDFMELTLQAFPEPLAEAGTTYMPSEQGYRLLGLVIEAVSGEDYNTYIGTHILEAAGLTATAPCETVSANLATGYIVEGGQPVEVDFPNTSYAYAYGNLCSTAADMVQWQYAISSNQLISEESVAAMYKPVNLKNGDPVKPNSDALAGFGCVLGEDSMGGYYVSYTGSVPGFEAVVRTYYARNLVVVALSDTAVPEARRESGNGLERMLDQVVWTMKDNFLLD